MLAKFDLFEKFLIGVFVIGCLTIWPVSALRKRRERREEVALEDALKHLHSAAECGREASVESLAGALGISTERAAELVRELHDRGLVTSSLGLRLTPSGERWARSIIRAHRLWERYLADDVRTSPEEVHGLADRQEHILTREEVDELAARLGHPLRDPHGDPIPNAQGVLEAQISWPLTMMTPGTQCEIVHLEDEPATVYARLVALGLEPGQELALESASAERLVFELEGLRHELRPVDAANVFVVQTPQRARTPRRTLADLEPGERARITGLRIDGLARRRLLDLGFTPGARVECELRSPFGEPIAYRLRGTLIALRQEQAEGIDVEFVERGVGE